MTRLRVLYVVDDLAVGGTRAVMLSQIAQLPRDRVDIGILTLADDLTVATELAPADVSVFSAPMPRDLGYRARDYLADSWLLLSARRWGGPALRAIESFAPDILHFHTNPRTLALGIRARRRSPVGLVFTDHLVRIRATDYSPQARFLLRLAYRRLYTRYHVISVGGSVATANRAAGLLSPHRRQLVMDNQVDINRFRPPVDWQRARPPEVLYLGRLHPVKRVDTLIRAFAQVRTRTPVTLLIVGPDEMDGELQALASESVRPPRTVAFLGAQGDVAEILQRGSIAVSMSEREGQSLALLEQMASGLAVVVSDIPESTALISDGVNGLVVPAGDADACASALERLLADEALRLRLGRAARQSAEACAASDAGRLLLDFYRQVVTETR